ncbi:hypothetical protein NHJ6243_009743 [Beauveria neobassiana]
MADIDEHHDVVILGAGLSGINTAHILREKLPHRKITVLEARPVIGGTWSFFKYPGFRCDSMMTNFGFKWYPWPHENKIAGAAQILEYLVNAARHDGILDSIRLSHRVTCCEWRTSDHVWRLTVESKGRQRIYSANFVLSCTGYYSYEKAQNVTIPGIGEFKGIVVHPQWWPEDLDYQGKRVVVIGSGATAITLIPAMAEKAAHITMLQRSPSYVAALPSKAPADAVLRFLLPIAWAGWLLWWKDMLFETLTTVFLLSFPSLGRRILTSKLQKQVPKDVDTEIHFRPRYNPHQQRLCISPDGDFFKTLHRENTEILTGMIEAVTDSGIILKSGKEIPADIIVTATGLFVQLMSGMRPIVDGTSIDVGTRYTWRGCMLESLPNLGYILGYPVQSWTPGAEITAKVLARVIACMEAKNVAKVVPKINRYKDMPAEPALTNVNSNYFLTAIDRIPKSTGQSPWYGRTHWLNDMWLAWTSHIDEGLSFTGKMKVS